MRWKRLIKDLALALVNATLVLAIVLVVCVIALLGRIAALQEATTAALAPQAARLERISMAVENIDARLTSRSACENPALVAELAALRAQVPEMARLQELGLQALGHALLDEAARRLGTVAPRS